MREAITNMTRPGSILMVGGIVMISLALSVKAQAADESELAKQTQNPVADLISIPFQNNMHFGL